MITVSSNFPKKVSVYACTGLINYVQDLFYFQEGLSLDNKVYIATQEELLHNDH